MALETEIIRFSDFENQQNRQKFKGIGAEEM